MNQVMSSVDKAIGETHKRINELREMINNHDCKLSEDHGCPCSFWTAEIRKLSGKPESVIQ